VLNLYPGKSLDRAQVAGVAHLVSSSVADMPLASVAIVDQHGNLLSAAPRAPGAGSGLNPGEFAYVQELEQGHVKRILDLLEPIAGRGNVRAQVTADIDFSQVESTAEQYRPNQGTESSSVRSTSISESSTGAGSGAAGVPGALSNQPVAAPATTSKDASSASLRKESVVNYEVDKTVKHVRAQVGSVKRLSAAILVNYKRPAAAAPAEGKAAEPKEEAKAGEAKATEARAVPLAFTEAELAQMDTLVKDAIGFSKDRGDSVNLVNAPFSAEPESAGVDTPLWQRPETVTVARETGKAAFLLAALGLIILGVIRPALRQIGASMQASEPRLAPDAPGLTAERPLTALPGAAPSQLADIQRIARDDPATVANVVRSWVQK
jgi:flagellar M-ring protein FliF